MKRNKLSEAIAVLTVMRKYDRELPDPAALFSLSDRRRRKLCRALDLVEESPVLDESRFVVLVPLLAEALPDEWPANFGSFARHFHEIVHGRTPTVRTIEVGDGGFEEQLVPLVAETPSAKA